MSNRINVSELDFNEIKQNFITFLKDQDKYKDYNFTGSNLSILLDILSYNTHYNNIYNNFIVNELFLDTATKRNTIVSLVKQLGYTPRSAISGKAVVDIVVSNTSLPRPDILVLPKGSEFVSTLDSNSYTYTTTETHTANLINDVYSFSGIELIQGVSLQNSYTATDEVRYIIPNVGCDLTTVKVKVQQSGQNSIVETYLSIENIIDSENDSSVFYTKEIENGLYEVYFGENIIGKQPENGSLVTIEYFVTSGEITNGLRSFSYTGSSLAGGLVTTTTIEQSASSVNPEEIESIRINAPNFYSSQNRAVNTLDFQTLIYNEVPNIDSISVWGGEDNVPVTYGKVFICIKPKSKDKLSLPEKNKIISLVKKKKMPGVTPVVVDYEKLSIVLLVNAFYDESKTNKKINDLKLIILEQISKYNTQMMNKFEAKFKYSPFSTMIDDSDDSMDSSITNVKLKKSFVPSFNQKNTYTINVFNPIDSLDSTPFFIPGYEESVYFKSFDSVIRVLKTTDNSVIYSNIGNVDLENGIININQLLTISSAENNEITFTIEPQSYDISSKLNTIASIDLVESEVNVISKNSNIKIAIK